jgi:RNA polymerase sigma-70 factor (ECF subfamily)
MEIYMDEITAIRRMKAGDFGGLESLMARYQVKAARAAFLITRDKAQAEDVVQQVFLHLFQHPNRFDENHPFEPYLMRSVVNAALNVCRNEKLIISLEGNIETVERLISQAASVESQTEYSQLKGEILQALGQLPPRQRAAVVQRYYLDMSEQEMALALDAAPGTVKWLLNSARAGLRELLKKERI